MKLTVEVMNCPDYAKECKYIVCNLCDGELWFYGAWNEKESAYKAAEQLGDSTVVVMNGVEE